MAALHVGIAALRLLVVIRLAFEPDAGELIRLAGFRLPVRRIQAASGGSTAKTCSFRS